MSRPFLSLVSDAVLQEDDLIADIFCRNAGLSARLRSRRHLCRRISVALLEALMM